MAEPDTTSGHQRPEDDRPLHARHLWQIQPLRDVLVLLAGFGLIWLGWKLSFVTVPLLLALLLAYLFEPLMAWVTRDGRVSRAAAAIGVIASVTVLAAIPVGAGVAFGVRSSVAFIDGAGSNVILLHDAVTSDEEEALDRLPNEAWRSLAERLRIARLALDEEPEDVDGEDPADMQEGVPGDASEAQPGTPVESSEVAQPSWIEQAAVRLIADTTTWLRSNRQTVGQQAITTAGDVAQVLIRVVGSIGYLLFAGFLTAFFFYFISTAWGRVLAWFDSLIPTDQHETVVALAKKMDRAIAGFVRGRLTIALILSVLFTIAYALIGTPAAILVGLVTGVFSVVPYLAMIGILMAWGTMFLDPAEGIRGMWWWVLLAPPIVYFILQTIDEYVLTPWIVGKSTNISTPTILFASLAGAGVAGFYGVLIAIPVAACLKIVLEEVVWPKFQAWVRGEARDPLPVAARDDD